MAKETVDVLIVKKRSCLLSQELTSYLIIFVDSKKNHGSMLDGDTMLVNNSIQSS